MYINLNFVSNEIDYNLLDIVTFTCNKWKTSLNDTQTNCGAKS